MDCPHCQSSTTTERSERTELGYRQFRCGTCSQGFNERTGTLFNRLQYPTDVICLVVLWRMRYKLRLRDLAEMFLDRGVVFTHEVVREWEAKLATVLSETLRRHRRGRVGRSWYCDETYLKVKGHWVYLYRGIDRDGNLVDVFLSEKRDRTAAEAFFRSARTVTDLMPDRVTTDGMAPTPEPLRRNWEKVSRIAPTVILITIWNKTIEASSNGRTRCVDSKVLSRRSGSVGCMKRYAISFAHARNGMSRCHWRGNALCIWAGYGSLWQRWRWHKEPIKKRGYSCPASLA